MAKKSEPICMCSADACRKCALLALIAGILFLLQDLGIWAFWNISWYTVGFILAGLVFLLGHKK